MVLLGTVFISGGLNSQAQSPIDTGLSFQEFLDDRVNGSGNFSSYDPGDIIEVEDTIEAIQYYPDKDESVLWLQSTGSNPRTSPNLIFISNLKSKYKEGEMIRITFSIFIDSSRITEDYYYDKDNIEHITFLDDPQKDEDGIDIFGYNISLPKELDNNYGRFFVYLLIWLIIASIILVILNVIINKLVAKPKIDVSIIRIIRKPIFVLIIIFGSIQSLTALGLSEESLFWIQQIYNIGLFLIVIWLIYKIFNVTLIQVGRRLDKGKKEKFDKVLMPVLKKLISVLIVIFAIFTLLSYIGVDLTSIAIGGMVFSLVIAFAAQETLSNFFAGMFLISESDFNENDIIMLDNVAYKVIKVGMRNTKLYDIKEHMLIIIPNNILANNKIINLSEPNTNLKVFISIGVSYGTDPNKVKGILLDIAQKQSHVLKEPEEFAPTVRFWEFAESSLNFYLIIWIDDLYERFSVRNDINFEIDRRFKKENIEIPFPQRVVHLIK